jgi:hypothetical protein
MKKIVFKDAIKINHPLAEKISVQDSEYHHCIPGKSSEVAFFKNKKFQTEIVEEFADYAENSEGETLVYGWVPNFIVEKFLEQYRVSA